MTRKHRGVAPQRTQTGDDPAPVERLDDSVGAEMHAEFKASDRADLIDCINEGAGVTSTEIANGFRLARSWPARVMALWSNRVEDISSLIHEFNATNGLFSSLRSVFRPVGSVPMRVGHLTFPSATLAGYGILRLFLWRLWDCEDSRRRDEAIADSCQTEFLNGVAIRCPTDAVIGVRDERGPIDAGFPAELAWMFAPSHLEFLQELRTKFLEDHSIDESVPSAIETYGEVEQQAWAATLPEGEPTNDKIVWSRQFTKKDWAQYLGYENADSMKEFVRMNRSKGRADDEANKQKCRFDVSLIREKRPQYDDNVGILDELQKRRQGSKPDNRSENRR